MQRASAHAGKWRRANHGRAVPIAVNLSTHQLADPALAAEVAASLMAGDALPSDVVIEITESAVLQDVEGATERLAALREMGVRVSIDDFGTGYSSLSYLQRLPIDELKIDRSFIQRLGHGPTGAIVGSIVDLAHAIGLSVVAEGIETEEQLAILRALECDLGQGFLLARPQPGTHMLGLLQQTSLAPLHHG
jgi:EAL domain-containing protein (putative c-di-GMP-specific phosphodiesterase class I)